MKITRNTIAFAVARWQWASALGFFLGAAIAVASGGLGAGGFQPPTGGGGAGSVSGTSPISVSNNVVSMPAAAAGQSGYVSTADQHFTGIKRFDDLIVGTGTYPCNSLFTCGAETTGGIVVGGPIGPIADDGQVELMGSKTNTDPGTGVSVTSQHYRDAGAYFGINAGHPCNTQFFSVDSMGNVNFSATPLSDCSSDSNAAHGTLTDVSPGSGHVALQSSDQHYLNLRGRDAANHSGLQVDGGHPGADGGTWVQAESDGGTYFAYAGLHGNVTLSMPEGLYGGWSFEIDNPNGVGSMEKFYIDAEGGIGNSHGLTFAALPLCPGVTINTTIGQYFYGAKTGTLMSADDTQRWYLCKTTGWKRIITEDDP